MERENFEVLNRKMGKSLQKITTENKTISGKSK